MEKQYYTCYLAILGIKGRDRKEKRHYLKIENYSADEPTAETFNKAERKVIKDFLTQFKTYKKAASLSLHKTSDEGELTSTVMMPESTQLILLP